MSRKTGDWGEKIALEFLSNQGIRVLHTNWRSGRCELDIVGIDGEILVFFEVKVRKFGGLGDVIDAIDQQQMSRLAKAASAYMHEFGYDAEVRFDLIGLTYFDKNNYKIDHLKDIFFPGTI